MMDIFFKARKPQQWQTLKATGGADAALTSLAALPTMPAAVNWKFENQPMSIEYFVDFDAAAGECDITWFIFTANGLVGVPADDTPEHVKAVNQAGTGVYRSARKVLDLKGGSYAVPIVANLAGGATAVAIYGKQEF